MLNENENQVTEPFDDSSEENFVPAPNADKRWRYRPKKTFRGGNYSVNVPDVSALTGANKTELKLIKKYHPDSKGIRKVACLSGLLMLCVVFLPTLIAYGPIISGNTYFRYIFYPFVLVSRFLDSFLSAEIVGEINQIIYSMTLFTLPFIFFAWCFKFKLTQTVAFSAPKKGTVLPFLFLGVGFCAFANIASSSVTSFFESIGFNSPVSAGSQQPEGILGFIIVMISTSFIPGMVEEFAFRGVLYGVLKKYGEGFAIIATAILFGVLHGNIVQIPFAFVVGLGLGYIRAKSGSVWICIVVHAINNAISVLYQYPLSHLNQELQNITYTVYLCVAMLLSILGVCLISSKNSKEDFYILNRETTCHKRVVSSLFYTHPTIIIFFSVVALSLLGSWGYRG